MKINRNQVGNALTLSLEGRLDTTTAPELEREIRDGLEGIDTLTMDLGKLDYISSAGLRVLLSAHKTMSRRGGMTVANANEMVMEVFEVTGFSDILTLE